MTEEARFAELKARIASYEQDAPPANTGMLCRFGGAVKATKDSSVIEGLLVPYGGPEDLDHDGEFFTPRTDYGVRIPAAVKLHYHHGQNGKVGKVPLAWAELERREDGVWFKADLSGELEEWLEEEREQAKKYQIATLALAREGMLGASSGAASHLVMSRAAGKGHELTRWPLAEASVTPTPASPRTFGSVAVKSLADVPDLETLAAKCAAPPAAEEAAQVSLPDSLVPELLAEHTALVVSAVRGFTQRVDDRLAARIKAGRMFSQANMDELIAVHGEMETLTARLTALMEKAVPKTDQAAGEKSSRIDHLRLRTRLLGQQLGVSP